MNETPQPKVAVPAPPPLPAPRPQIATDYEDKRTVSHQQAGYHVRAVCDGHPGAQAWNDYDRRRRAHEKAALAVADATAKEAEAADELRVAAVVALEAGRGLLRMIEQSTASAQEKYTTALEAAQAAHKAFLTDHHLASALARATDAEANAEGAMQAWAERLKVQQQRVAVLEAAAGVAQ